MGDVYEEQNRYDQFLQQALNQGNAEESMDLSYNNMHQQALESAAQNKTLNEELVFSMAPGVIQHGLEIFQRARSLYDKFQQISEQVTTKGKTVLSNLKTLPDDVQTLYKTKINQIQEALGDKSEAGYNRAKGLYNDLKQNLEKGKQSVLAPVEDIKATGENIINQAKATGQNVVDQAKATGQNVVDQVKSTGQNVVDQVKATGQNVVEQAKATGENVVDQVKGEALLPRPRQQGIAFKRWVDEQSPVADKRNVLLNKATTSEERANIMSASDDNIHAKFGKLRVDANNPHYVQPIKPLAETSDTVLDQAKTAGGAMLEQGKTEGGAMLQQAQATEETVLQTVKPTNVALPDIELQDLKATHEYTNPLFEKPESSYATNELYPKTGENLSFGNVKTYANSQAGELGNKVPVLPTNQQTSNFGENKIAVPKIPSVVNAVEGEGASMLDTVKNIGGKIAEYAPEAIGIGAGIYGDVMLGKGQVTSTAQKVQIGMGNIPIAETIINRGSEVVDKVQGALTQTAEQVSSKATEASEQVASLAPKVSEAVTSARTAGQETAESVTSAASDAVSGATEAASSTLSTLAEIGSVNVVADAIPIVGSVIEFGTLMYGLVTGLEGLFDHKEAPPPPQAVQQASIVHQAGI